MRRSRRAVRRGPEWLGGALIALALTAGCTTYLRPIQCQGEPHRCNEVEDAEFCEFEVVSADGADCAGLGLVATKHFCVVTKGPCAETTYAVKDRECRVARYVTRSEKGECSPGTPTFIDP